MKIKDMIGGSGGGSSSGTQTADNLFTKDQVEVVLGLSEGPIYGLEDGMKSFYVGGTPLMSQDGSINFEDFNLGIKLGDVGDTPVNYILGGESSNNQVGTLMLQGVYVTRQTDQSLRGVIDQIQVRLNITQLYTQNDKGTFNNTAKFHIQYKQSTLGGWVSVYGNPITVYAKTSSGAIMEYAFDVPRVDDDWQIRVMKENSDTDTDNICVMSWESFQSVTKSNRTYSNLALVHLVAQATSQFSSIPDFAGIYKGMLFQVPSNYNPDTGTYDESGGYWDGSFQSNLRYCNNPAIVLYNLISNTRYGMAKYYPHIVANRFDFYEAAKWCDGLVPDGAGGTQRRYTFNMVIDQQRSGLDLLNYIAGSFGGTVFDDATGAVYLRVDKWEDPKLIFTPQNITADGFNYSFTDMTTRYNDLTVKFVNPDLDWATDVRSVQDPVHIAKYGSIPYDFEEVGCTNVHEAVRRGFYKLITATTECAQVAFTTTRLGEIADPWSIIFVADPSPGISTPGRIKSISGSTIYLRDPIYFSVNQNFTMLIQAVSGVGSLVVCPDAVGNIYQLRIVSGIVPGDLPDRTTFTIEDSGGFGIAKPFRVIDVSGVDGSPDQYSITAVEVNVNKWTAADNATPSTPTQYSFKNPLIPLAPTGLQLTSGTDQLILGKDGSITARILAQWEPPANSFVDHYDFSFKPSDQSNWIDGTSTGSSAFLEPVVSGTYYDIRLWSVSIAGYRSVAAGADRYLVVGKDQPPSNVTNFTIITRDTDMLLQWDAIPDLDRSSYEIREGESWDAGTVLVTDYSATQFAVIIQDSGTYNFMIKAKDTSGNYSLLPTYNAVIVIGPSSVKGVIIVQSGTRLEMRWNPNPETNIVDYEIREGNSWATGVFVTKTKSTSYSLTAGAAGTRIFWLKAIATPGIYSDKATFVTTDVAKLDDTNLIYTTDESANGWTGVRYNMITYGDSLRMDDGVKNAEYLFDVNLPTFFRAQNTLFVTLDSITDFGYTWEGATFPWTDDRAKRAWAAQGDISAINYKAEISMLTVPPSDILYSWRLNNKLDNDVSQDDGQPTEQLNVSYAAARYGAGAYINNLAKPQATKITFSTNIPTTYSTMFWVLPVDVDTNDTYASLVGRDNQQITIGWEAQYMAFYAIDDLGQKLMLPFGIRKGSRYALMLVQDTNSRTLYASREDGTNASVTAKFPAVGAAIYYSLY